MSSLPPSSDSPNKKAKRSKNEEKLADVVKTEAVEASGTSFTEETEKKMGRSAKTGRQHAYMLIELVPH